MKEEKGTLASLKNKEELLNDQTQIEKIEKLLDKKWRRKKMMLRKYMSIIGIGAAKIDLVLPQNTYRLGECIQGYFLIKGGVIEQKLKRIECDLVMVDQTTGIEKVMDTINILTSKFIHSEETNQLSFKYRLPSDLPLSTKEISYHFKTRLFFNEGVDSRDQDVIEIIE